MKKLLITLSVLFLFGCNETSIIQPHSSPEEITLPETPIQTKTVQCFTTSESDDSAKVKKCAEHRDRETKNSIDDASKNLKKLCEAKCKATCVVDTSMTDKTKSVTTCGSAITTCISKCPQ